MNSTRPKVLHEVGNFPLISHCIKTAQSIDPKKILIVLGHGQSEIKKVLGNAVNSIDFAIQEEQLGTGHAVSIATNELTEFDGNLIVLYGDTPFVSAETMTKMKNACKRADLVVLGFHPQDSTGYGRLVTKDKELLRIVEHKDANDEELEITLCNSGVMAGSAILIKSF